jgi:hypothetical protein
MPTTALRRNVVSNGLPCTRNSTATESSDVVSASGNFSHVRLPAKTSSMGQTVS